jgi:hypothetical protein
MGKGRVPCGIVFVSIKKEITIKKRRGDGTLPFFVLSTLNDLKKLPA